MLPRIASFPPLFFFCLIDCGIDCGGSGAASVSTHKSAYTTTLLPCPTRLQQHPDCDIGEAHQIRSPSAPSAIAVPCRGAGADSSFNVVSASTQPHPVLIISRTQPTATRPQMTLKVVFLHHFLRDSCFLFFSGHP